MGQLVHVLAQCEIPLLCFDEIAHELINISGSCCLKNFIQSFLVFFQFGFGYKRSNFLLTKSPERLQTLLPEILLLLLLGLPVDFLQLSLFGLFLPHELLHLFLLFDFLVDKLYLLVELLLFLLSLPDQLRELIRRHLSILVCIIRNLHDPLHFFLFVIEVIRQFRVDLLKYLPLPPQLVNFLPELVVAGDG